MILQSKSHARCMARIMLHVASVVPDSHSNIRATCLPGARCRMRLAYFVLAPLLRRSPFFTIQTKSADW